MCIRDSSQAVFQSDGLIISGGVLGTLDLLFKQKYLYKTLPELSDTLGQHVLSNSESISGVIGTDKKLNNGAVSYTHLDVYKRQFFIRITGMGPIVHYIKTYCSKPKSQGGT